MGLWERVRVAFGREKRDVDDAMRELEERADRALDARERELHATPDERLAMERERGEEVDAAFEEARRRIEGDLGRE